MQLKINSIEDKWTVIASIINNAAYQSRQESKNELIDRLYKWKALCTGKESIKQIK